MGSMIFTFIYRFRSAIVQTLMYTTYLHSYIYILYIYIHIQVPQRDCADAHVYDRPCAPQLRRLRALVRRPAADQEHAQQGAYLFAFTFFIHHSAIITIAARARRVRVGGCVRVCMRACLHAHVHPAHGTALVEAGASVHACQACVRACT